MIAGWTPGSWTAEQREQIIRAARPSPVSLVKRFQHDVIYSEFCRPPKVPQFTTTTGSDHHDG